MDRRPEFEHFPLSREQVRTLIDQKTQIQKQYSQNRQQIMKISQKNIPQATIFLQRLYERDQMLQQNLNWINQVMRTNQLLSMKKNKEQKFNMQAKQKSKHLINSYKSVMLEKKQNQLLQKQQQKSNQLIVMKNNLKVNQLQRQREQQIRNNKKQILQSYLLQHNMSKTQKKYPSNARYSSTTQQAFSNTNMQSNSQLAQQYLLNQTHAKRYNSKQRSSNNVGDILGSTDSKLMRIGNYSLNKS